MAQTVTSQPTPEPTEPRPFFGIRSYLHLLYERGSQDVEEDEEEQAEQGYSFVQPRETGEHRTRFHTCFRLTLMLSLLGLLTGSILAAAGFIISPTSNWTTSSPSTATSPTKSPSTSQVSREVVTGEKSHRPLDEAVDSFVHSKLSMGGLVVLGVSTFVLSCNLLLPVIASTSCGHLCQRWLLKLTGSTDEDAAQLILPSNRNRKRSLSRIPVNQSFESIQPSRQTDQDS